MLFIHARPSDTVFSAAADHLSRILMQTHEPLLFLSSGGSALQLANSITLYGPTDRFAISVLDERWTTDPSQHNYSLLEKTSLYQSIISEGGTSISTHPQKGESRTDLAQRLDMALRLWTESHPTGRIIATLGIGDDGHTAGIFPLSKEDFYNQYEKTDRWVVDQDYAKALGSRERITVTLPFMQRIDIAILCVSGLAKETVFHDMLQSEKEIHAIPARIVHHMSEVHCYTDLLV